MRPPVNSLRADLVRSAQAAREAKAEELFSPEVVRVKLSAAASAGFDHVTIDAPDGLDLRDTPAGIAGKTWAVEMKLAATWSARTGGAGTDGTTSFSLVIEWKPKAPPS